MDAATQGATDEPWLINVDGTVYRWCIWAHDDGLELHIQDHESGGTLLVIEGLRCGPDQRDWQLGEQKGEDIRFTSLPDGKVKELIRLARAKGWRHNMRDQIFRLNSS